MKICVLASGSSGNCLYLEAGEARILIDGGLSCRETTGRLKAVGVDLADIDALCVTHEHDDHTSSIGALYRKAGMQLYANSGTVEALGRDARLSDLPWNVFSTNSGFRIRDVLVEPFTVPHDAYDPVGFLVSSGDTRAGIVTDMGAPTDMIRERLKNCRVVVMEANHDEELLRESARPWSLKQRIASRQGHLSNDQAAQLAVDIAAQDLKALLLAHLSADCNSPESALKTVRAALDRAGRGDVVVKLTYADRASDVVEV
jgi:phosphoribosyl 1,2-cyclic phosphodiesterase